MTASLLCVKAYYLSSVDSLLSYWRRAPQRQRPPAPSRGAPPSLARHHSYSAAAPAGRTLDRQGCTAGQLMGCSVIYASLRVPFPPRQLLASGTLRRGVCPARANRKRPREQFKRRWRLGRCVAPLGAGGRERSERLPCRRRPRAQRPRGWRTREPWRSACVCGRSSPGEAPSGREGRTRAPGLRGGCSAVRGLGVPRLPWVLLGPRGRHYRTTKRGRRGHKCGVRPRGGRREPEQTGLAGAWGWEVLAVRWG